MRADPALSDVEVRKRQKLFHDQAEGTRPREDQEMMLRMQNGPDQALLDRDALKLELGILKIETEGIVRERNLWRSQFDILKKQFVSKTTSEPGDIIHRPSDRGLSTGRDSGDIVQLQEEVGRLKKERDDLQEKLGNITKEKDEALRKSCNNEYAAQKLAKDSELSEAKARVEEISKDRDNLRDLLEDALKSKEGLQNDNFQLRADADKLQASLFLYIYSHNGVHNA